MKIPVISYNIADRKFLKINIDLERNETSEYINRKQEMLLDKYVAEKDEVNNVVAIKKAKK